MKRLVCIFIAAAMLLCFASCGANNAPEENKDDREESAGTDKIEAELDVTGEKAMTDFSMKLAAAYMSGDKSAMLSPVSVLFALALAENGANGATLSEMENAIGLDKVKLAQALKAFADLTKDSLKNANAVFMKDDDDYIYGEDWQKFLKENFDAEFFKEAFDKETLAKINAWISEKTDGKIENALEDIPEDAMMYLINAVAFREKWKKGYTELAVSEGDFTKENGEKVKVEMMHSTEDKYIEGDGLTGFIKNYEDGKYAFAAILPNEGVSVKALAEKLDGDAFVKLINGARDVDVRTRMPKFESDFSDNLNGVLMSLGINTAFGNDADFTALAKSKTDETKNPKIGKVIHKTHIKVTESGTEAEAVTIVEMVAMSAEPREKEIKEVFLTRPYIYVIYETGSLIPVFIGCNANGSK